MRRGATGRTLPAMQARRLRLGHEPLDGAMGSVLAADVRGPDGRAVLRKGTRLAEQHRAALSTMKGVSLHLIDLAADELEQDEVASRLVGAIAGPGTQPGTASQGQARLRATWRGLLRIDADALARINARPPLLVFTRPSGQIVVEDDEVAGAKSAALATSEAAVHDVEALGRSGPIVRVEAFARRRIAVVMTDRLQAGGRALMAEAVRRKIEWFGSELVSITEIAHEPDAVERELRARTAEGVELMLFSGANPLDPLDAAFEAIAAVGGRTDRSGVPAHPGSMVWIGEVAGVPVLGIAACAGFGKNTALDLLLARVLAGEEPARAADELGHGGLVEGPSAVMWFPPYDRGGVSAARDASVAAPVGAK